MSFSLGMQRDKDLDFVKGVLIFLVVLGHCLQFIVYRESELFWLDPVFCAIYTFHMPAFIALSGLLAAAKIGPEVSFGDVLRDRVLSLFWPLVLWSTIAGIPRVWKAAGEGPGDAITLWLGGLLGAYWFLWAVIIGAILARLSSGFGRRTGMVAAVLSIAVVLAPFESDPFPPIRATVPFYLAGYVAGRADLTLKHLPLWIGLASAIIAVTGAVFWQPETYIYKNRLAYWQVDVLSNIALMGLVWAAGTIAFLRLTVEVYSRVRPSWATDAFCKVGRFTLQIYLVHLAAVPFARLLPPLSVGTMVGYLIAVAITTTLVAAIYFACRLLERWPTLDRVVWARWR